MQTGRVPESLHAREEHKIGDLQVCEQKNLQNEAKTNKQKHPPIILLPVYLLFHLFDASSATLIKYTSDTVIW